VPAARSSDRHLTVGLAVTGRHPAARTGPERNMPAPLTPPVTRAGPGSRNRTFPSPRGRSQQQPASRMLLPGDPTPGSEPTEVCMVRRRSTVRFRKGAPAHGDFSSIHPLFYPPKSATRVPLVRLLRLAQHPFPGYGAQSSVSGAGKRYQVRRGDGHLTIGQLLTLGTT
jgi:hypothetical protein